MPAFRYTGRNAQGAKVNGAVEGISADAVASELLARQITPLTIEAE
ncbi:type II secretion system F family protein, partial [Leptospira borgpetersenii serovar Ballum]|nr:type II secretion system F family protein [Leptospira borgpetersenii serovar Ballum]